MQKVSRLIQSFTPSTYDLSLTLERVERTFKGIITIQGDSHQASAFRLHAKELVIESASVNGKAAEWSTYPNDELEITANHITEGPQTVVIAFNGIITEQMHGLYPSQFTHDGENKELLATQFESHHAREVFPCVDEPEAKATFNLTLTTETGITVLGNMPVKLQREENETLITTFETSPRMSSYLLAWVVGELHKASTTTKTGVEVNVWATPNQPVESLSFALDIAARTIDFFDEYFDTPYPLPKSDHVALPDFSSGAMENWGLITYREVALLADPKTISISSKRYIATVVAHELAHQWFGNLVTMKWWNNLWLNESFANLMEYIAVDALHPEWDIWLDYSSHETIMALRRDALDGVQAVQTDVDHPDEISTLFDGAIVYAKGGRLLRMLQHYVGHEAFRTGLSSYFKKYAYKNTEADDLWNELALASGKDIAGFMNAWITQPGYPVVHVEEDGLRQEQFFTSAHEPSDRLWPIPLGSNALDAPVLMQEQQVTTNLQPGERLNIGDAAHFITHYSQDHLKALTDQLNTGSLTTVDRLQLLHEQTMLARGGISSSASLVPLLTAYENESAESVWDIIGLSLGELKKFVETNNDAEQALRKLSGAISSRQYARLGWQSTKDESETDTKLRATILGMTLYSQDSEAIETARTLYASGIDSLDPELRSLIISANVRYFETPELIDSLLETYRVSSADLQNDICAGITSTKNLETIYTLLDVLKDASIVRRQDIFRWFVSLIRGKESRVPTWQWMKDNWQWIEDNFGGDKSFDDFPRYAATGLVTREQLEEYKVFFTPKLEIPALKRVIQLGIAEIEARVTLIERDSEAVHLTLSQ